MTLLRYVAFALLPILAVEAAIPEGQTPSPEAARHYYLNDLTLSQNYSPGKNSFLLQNLRRGERKTLLDLSGGGSVRHIWSTWSVPGDDSDTAPNGKVFLRVFVDGNPAPSMAGTLDELCRAAEATGTTYVPLPAFNFKGAFNFYLPVFFGNGIRIELEALADLSEFYTQIDYRLEPGEKHGARLVSRRAGSELVLSYTGADPPAFGNTQPPAVRLSRVNRDLRYSPGPTGGEFIIEGPGVLRQLTFRGDNLQDLTLSIYWDGEAQPSVEAPLRYFFADFRNAAMESDAKTMTCYFPMPFHAKARIVLRSEKGVAGHAGIEYALERKEVAKGVLYFHARYQEMPRTLGYSQFPVVSTRGRGLFVGVNLFDSGHNHGGGDAALIDAGTLQPHLLHGICGEDYFAFAWHHTGTMTLLTGAPLHTQRYRLHLENPYPFQESFQFLFGTFAGVAPKSVAFWYQLPEKTPATDLVAPDIRWKVLGPVGPGTALPVPVNDRTFETTVLIKEPTALHERWQDTDMTAGFVDLTYQFRHYVFVESGTGFVPGPNLTQLTTGVYSPSNQTVNAVLGHDDGVVVRLNGKPVSDLPARSGFGPSNIRLALTRGWNTLELVVSNEENVNWRWSGISFAVERSSKPGEALRFSTVY